MTAETKQHLIVGGGLILAVVVGIVVYKKYQVSSQAGQAASDQATQDELAYIEEMSLQGGSEFGSVGGGSSITIPSAPATSTSLADEITQLEQAFGFGPPASTASGSSSSSSSSSSSPSSGSLPLPKRVTTGPGPLKPGSDLLVAGHFNMNDEPVGPEGSYLA